MFLHDTPKDWEFQVYMYAYAHNSELKISSHEIVFHTRPRIPLTFDLNLTRDTSKICISHYCSQHPEHSHYDKTDLNPFFYRPLSKPIPQWFLAVETEMLQIYSSVYENTFNIIFQYTNPFPFETEPHTIHTIPLAREHCDSYLYYIRQKALELTPSQNPFQVVFNPVKGISTGTYYRTIHPQNIRLSIQDVFITYMQKI